MARRLQYVGVKHQAFLACDAGNGLDVLGVIEDHLKVLQLGQPGNGTPVFEVLV